MCVRKLRSVSKHGKKYYIVYVNYMQLVSKTIYRLKTNYNIYFIIGIWLKITLIFNNRLISICLYLLMNNII